MFSVVSVQSAHPGLWGESQCDRPLPVKPYPVRCYMVHTPPHPLTHRSLRNPCPGPTSTYIETVVLVYHFQKYSHPRTMYRIVIIFTKFYMISREFFEEARKCPVKMAKSPRGDHYRVFWKCNWLNKKSFKSWCRELHLESELVNVSKNIPIVSITISPSQIWVQVVTETFSFFFSFMGLGGLTVFLLTGFNGCLSQYNNGRDLVSQDIWDQNKKVRNMLSWISCTVHSDPFTKSNTEQDGNQEMVVQ